MTFGQGTGPGVDGLTAAVFAGGEYLQTGSGSSVTSPATFGMVVAFATTTLPNGRFLYWQGWSIATDALGDISLGANGVSAFGSTSVVDGHTHIAAVASNGTTATLIVDGVNVGCHMR
jgi:hypothetical protein